MQRVYGSRQPWANPEMANPEIMATSTILKDQAYSYACENRTVLPQVSDVRPFMRVGAFRTTLLMSALS
jgi:hypothetical protein